MVRISDILKYKGNLPEPEPPKRKEPEAKVPPAEETREKSGDERTVEKKAVEKEADSRQRPAVELPAKEKPVVENVQVSKAMADRESDAESQMQVVKAMHEVQFRPEESRRIYSRGLTAIKDILAKIQSQSGDIYIREAEEAVRDIVDHIVLGDKELILLTINHSEDNYLYGHSVNICILSIELGLGLGYNKSKLNELGMAALLSDIGMSKIADIARQSRPLSEQEHVDIRKHPGWGSEMLKNKIKNIQDYVIRVCEQVHERIDGTGYPKGLRNGDICEYAKIVSAVDVYEALTHPRPYRKANEPSDAVKELLTMAASGSFETEIVKMLINRIGLYPVGSWVELNTNEIGKVVSANYNYPLRPRINVIFGPDKEKLPNIKTVDLARHATFYIKHSISPQKLNLNPE